MSKKILVVDDQQMLLDVLTEALELGGYESVTANNGLKALALLNENDINLVITDMRMPGMDGWEFCKKAREISSAPFIMLTGLGKPNIEPGMEGLVDAFLGKPIEIRALLEQVDSLIASRHTVFGA
jgi:CheY-like chemotaxis protein